MELLKGYKTYIIVAIGVIVYGLEAMGVTEKGTAAQLEGLLALLGLGTLRAGVKSDTGK